MTANMKFEVQDWQTAVDLYSQARSIYEKLAGAFRDEDVRLMYLQKVEEISPNIRYCAYNLGQGGVDINELMNMKLSGVGQDMLASKIDVSYYPNLVYFAREICSVRLTLFGLGLLQQRCSTFSHLKS